MFHSMPSIQIKITNTKALTESNLWSWYYNRSVRRILLKDALLKDFVKKKNCLINQPKIDLKNCGTRVET